MGEYYGYAIPELIRLLGSRFREYRMRADMTQKEVSEQSGISVTTIHKFENGVAANLSLGTLLQLLKAIGQIDGAVPASLAAEDHVPVRVFPHNLHPPVHEHAASSENVKDRIRIVTFFQVVNGPAEGAGHGRRVHGLSMFWKMMCFTVCDRAVSRHLSVRRRIIRNGGLAHVPSFLQSTL